MGAMSSNRDQFLREVFDNVPEGRLNAVVLHMMRQQIASFVEGLDVRGLQQLHRELEKSATRPLGAARSLSI
jgi:hypothetical protein